MHISKASYASAVITCRQDIHPSVCHMLVFCQLGSWNQIIFTCQSHQNL